MFVAAYWWDVRPGKEEQFRAAWRRGTELIRAIYGSHGSRLHREEREDGAIRFIGVAEETVAMDERISYYPTGAAGTPATSEILAAAVTTVDRATRHNADVSTARTGSVDDDRLVGLVSLLHRSTPGELHLHRSETNGDVALVVIFCDLIGQVGAGEAGGDVGDVLAELPDLLNGLVYLEFLLDQHVIP